MAVREFDGTDDDIVRDVGALSPMTYGTIVALVKPVLTGNAKIYFGLATSGDTDRMSVSFQQDAGGPWLNWFNADDGASETENTAIWTNDWWLVIWRKPSGSAVARMSAYDYDGDSWTHDNLDEEGATLGEWLAPGSGGVASFSSIALGDLFYNGRVAAEAAWSNSLGPSDAWTADASGDSAVEAAGLETAYQNWIDAFPDAAWRFSQASTGTSVVDDTGNGADQTSITGTTVINGDDPPGFDFSLDGGTAVGQATETDTAQPITSAKTKILGQATETDLAQNITAASTIVVPIGQAAETDAAQAIAAEGGAELGTSYDIRIDWDNDGDYDDTGENVTPRTRISNSIQYGRDQARSLSPIQPGQAVLALNNTSKDYTPGNAASPLFGLLEPGRRLRIQVDHDGTTYGLYRGFLDEYDLMPGFDDRYVSFTALDALARFREVEISTELHQGIRTGEAIGLVLDAIGWPEADRDLDQGATLIRWWWEEGTDGLTALDRIMQSEGIPALVAVDSDGQFVFRDRHHRLTDTRSLTPQATFRGSGNVEPVLADPFGYDLGWRDIINSARLTVNERSPSGVLDAVWSSDDIHSAADGETLEIEAVSSDPFLGAVTPVEGTDFRLRSGTVSVELSRASGAATTIRITASGGPAVLDQLQLRAHPVTVRRTVKIAASDAVSIEKYGTRAPRLDAPWGNVHDALAVAQLTLAHRAERLPIVQARVQSGLNDTDRRTEQLERDLSDRVTITVDLPSVDDDFHIEQIRHDFDGVTHATVFGCEQVPAQVADPLTFDVAGLGFDDGVFAKTGLSDPDNMWRFDEAGRGFNDGLLAF